MKPMFFTLRFTLKREIMNPISNYILSKYGQEAHDHTRPAFKEINKIRDSIDYYHIERLLKNSQKAGTDTAVENLLFYYTVLKNIYSYFEYAFYDHNGIEIPIPWSPAFLPLKAVLSNHFSYEYASVIFNLAFVYCNIGTKLVESPQESDLREALTKLKYALYLLEELKDIVPKIPLKSEDIPDMNPDYLNLIIDYITGMAYVALSKIDKLTDNKENVVDSHLKAAGIYFEAAYKKFVGSNCCYLLDEDKQNFEACLKACISAYPSTIPAGDAIEPILPVQPIPKGQIDFDQLFEILLSPEIAKLKADLKATIETYRLKTLLLRSKLDNLIGNQRKFYESSYLNSWLSLLTPHPVLPNKIARKIQKFREHKGRGAYLQAKKALIDFKENCQQTIRFIKGLLGSEKNQDNEIRNRLKDDPRLKEIEPSDYANKDLVASLEDIERQYLNLQIENDIILSKFDFYERNWLIHFSSSDEEAIAYFTKNLTEEFKPQLSEILSLHKNLRELIDSLIKQVHSVSSKDLSSAAIVGACLRIQQKKSTKEEEEKNLLQNCTVDIKKIEKQIDQGYILLEKIITLSNKIQTDNLAKEGPVKALEEIHQAIDDINQMHDSFIQKTVNKNLMPSVLEKLKALKESVRLYCQLRDKAKEEFLGKMGESDLYKQTGAVKYYDANTFEFALGESKFIFPEKATLDNESFNNCDLLQSIVFIKE